MRVAVVLLFAGMAYGQKQELGLTLGRLLSQDRSFPGGMLTSGGGTAFQANYGLRLKDWSKAALLFETHFLANPQRQVTSDTGSVTRDYATLYITPGVRVKFLQKKRVSPWVAIGGGYALYEHSETRLDGVLNQAPRHESHGAFTYGGGVDVRVWRMISARGEVRDFYTPSPNYNVAGAGSWQHNVVAGGGFVLRFGE